MSHSVAPAITPRVLDGRSSHTTTHEYTLCCTHTPAHAAMGATWCNIHKLPSRGGLCTSFQTTATGRSLHLILNSLPPCTMDTRTSLLSA